MRHHRLLACAAAALAILIAVPVALASTHAHHSRQVHGRVIAINARHHTLRLRVLHAKRASAASVSGGPAVVVYTPNPTPGSVVAVGVVDRTSHTSAPQYSAFNGTVTAPVGSDSAQVLVTGDGPLAGHTVTVQVTSTTHYKGQNASGGQVTSLADVQSGDIVSVYVLGSLTVTPIVAVYFADRGTGASSDPPAPPTPPAASTTPLARFGGTVTAVRGDGLTVSVTSGGPLAGQSVIVAIGPSVSFQTSNGTGSGPTNLQYISVGDQVEIFPASTSGTAPVVAAGVVDDSVPTGG